MLSSSRDPRFHLAGLVGQRRLGLMVQPDITLSIYSLESMKFQSHSSSGKISLLRQLSALCEYWPTGKVMGLCMVFSVMLLGAVLPVRAAVPGPVQSSPFATIDASIFISDLPISSLLGFDARGYRDPCIVTNRQERGGNNNASCTGIAAGGAVDGAAQLAVFAGHNNRFCCGYEYVACRAVEYGGAGAISGNLAA